MGHLIEITVFLVSISAVLLVSGLIVAKTYFPPKSKPPHTNQKIAFWFQDDQLQHSTEAGHQMLVDLVATNNLLDILTYFEHRFPGAKSLINNENSISELRSTWAHDQAILRVERQNKEIQIELLDSATASNIYKLRRSKHELEMMQNVVESTPFPVWQIAESGNIMMSNLAFRELGSELGCQLIQFAQSTNHPVERVKFEVDKNKPPHWFDINKFSLPESSVQYALDVTEIVRAQQAQKNFVQTLTKTFATLSIGLAIFDRNRQLMLFNPALIDLTTLPADFLSARPNLLTVFDKLRDKQIMPEPKNYATWREKLAIVVAAATEGTYTEIWNLPTGATFRISGRPHPDGALAFLFEDITAEVSMSRRFTAELELHRELLNNLDGAIAIFSISGELYHQNEAHALLWGNLSTDPEHRSTIQDASKLWHSRSKPTGIWGEIRDFVSQIDEREGWREEIVYDTDQRINVQVIPLMGQHTAVCFTY